MNKSQQSDKQSIRVFVARYPFDVISDYVPFARKLEIDNCGDVKVADGKYYAFKLLEIALRNVYGVDMRDCKLERSSNGKWQCDACELSISHCGDVVAVAISDLPVGVDVERIDSVRFDDKLQNRIFTLEEKSQSTLMTENEKKYYANRLWTVKEAAFKRDGGTAFVPSKIDTSAVRGNVKTVTVDNGYYLTAVASLSDCDIQYHAINAALAVD